MVMWGRFRFRNTQKKQNGSAKPTGRNTQYFVVSVDLAILAKKIFKTL